MFWFFIQFSVVAFIFLASTIASWYEGSTIIDNPWEWEYSTQISQIFHGEVNSAEQISQLDYFVYASKFQPTFPIVMLLSFLYLLILIGHQILKSHIKWFALYLLLLSGTLFILSFYLNNSHTVGGQKFYFLAISSGILISVVAIKLYFQNFSRNNKRNGNLIQLGLKNN